MMRFIIGTIFGGLVGVVIMCLCQTAGRDDKHMGFRQL